MRKIAAALMAALGLSGCIVWSVAETAVSVAGTVVETGVNVVGSAVKGVARTVSGSDDKNDKK